MLVFRMIGALIGTIVSPVSARLPSLWSKATGTGTQVLRSLEDKAAAVAHTQSRLMSLIEAITCTAVGFLVSLVTQILVLPLFGVWLSFSQNLWLAMIFTIVSILRTYVVRRFFNRVTGAGWVRHTPRHEETPLSRSK